MLQVEITPTKPEYAKYAFELRFICKRVYFANDCIKFFTIWGEDGWDRSIPITAGYFNIEITEVN
jgi:hypothetical protein